MKLVIDERVKHRLIGLAVILSIGAIFAPAIMKKSNQRLDSNVGVSVRLPPKPVLPKVAVADEEDMFKTIKVAHVELPAQPEPSKTTSLAKAESLSQMNEVQSAAPLIAKAESKKTIKPMLALHQPKSAPKVIKPAPKVVAVNKPASRKLPVTKPVIASKNKGHSGYAVQLATFSKQRNADSLVNRLRGKGYKASYNKIVINGGTVYKVLVGKTNQRQDAQNLQKQLASVMQIRGFVVPTEIS